MADLTRALEPVHALVALEISLLNVNVSLGMGTDFTRVTPPIGDPVGVNAPACT